MTLALLLAATAAAHPPTEESEQIARLIRLQPGMRVADVGAGDGEWAEAMAEALGSTGHVFLTEIDDGELIKLHSLVDESQLGNMSVVVGTPDATGLADGCCDAILLRLVYHHMSDRRSMRASLRRSLRDDGLLLIVEMDRDGHGFAADELVDEMTADGFVLVSRHPEWGGHDYQYAMVFRP